MSKGNYNGVGFNEEWVAAQTLEHFMEHEKHTGLKPAQLREVHRLCKAKHKKSSNSGTPEAGESDN